MKTREIFCPCVVLSKSPGEDVRVRSGKLDWSRGTEPEKDQSSKTIRRQLAPNVPVWGHWAKFVRIFRRHSETSRPLLFP